MGFYEVHPVVSEQKSSLLTHDQLTMLTTSPTTLQGPDGPLTVIFEEADDHQRIQCMKLGATSFREPLSAEDYVKREEYLAQRPLTRNGGLRYWCLRPGSDPAQILAKCQTIQRDIIVRDAKGCRQQQCYCIASVITDPQFRGYGLASLLLERVAKWMDGDGEATASMLYQSIGNVSPF
jgi:GNAT superfamily N-acetyltransferase